MGCESVQSQPKSACSKGNGSKSTTTSKDTTKQQSKKEVKQHVNASTVSGRRCFKCQSIEHIASECPNRRIVSLVEEVEEEEAEEV